MLDLVRTETRSASLQSLRTDSPRLDPRLVSRWSEYEAEASAARLRAQLAEIEARRADDDWYLVATRHRAHLARRRARQVLDSIGGSESLHWCSCS